eukprot:365123-Chlamydomonas_euryale.AAC.5
MQSTEGKPPAHSHQPEHDIVDLTDDGSGLVAAEAPAAALVHKAAKTARADPSLSCHQHEVVDLTNLDTHCSNTTSCTVATQPTAAASQVAATHVEVDRGWAECHLGAYRSEEAEAVLCCFLDDWRPSKRHPGLSWICVRGPKQQQQLSGSIFPGTETLGDVLSQLQAEVGDWQNGERFPAARRKQLTAKVGAIEEQVDSRLAPYLPCFPPILSILRLFGRGPGILL